MVTRSSWGSDLEWLVLLCLLRSLLLRRECRSVYESACVYHMLSEKNVTVNQSKRRIEG